MGFQQRWVLGLAVWFGLGVSIAAQNKAKPATKYIVAKSYCHPSALFCFKYPGTWMMLGEVLDGEGVVVAPSQPGERKNWNAVTVALVIPPPEAHAEPVTIEEAISQATSGVRKSGQSFVTLQRQQRTVDGEPAETVKWQYSEKDTERAWVEELVFIQGPESEIYSVALKCRPSSLSAMEPVFARIVDSWKAPGSQVETPAASKPKTPTTPPKSSAPPKP